MTLATPIAQHSISRFCPRHNPISVSPPPTGSRCLVMQSSRSSVNATCPTHVAAIPGQWHHQLTTPLSQWSGVPLFAGWRHSSTVEASMQQVSYILVALPAKLMLVSEIFPLVTSRWWRRAPTTSNSRLSQSVPKSCTKSLITLRSRGAAKRWSCPSYHIVMTSLNFVKKIDQFNDFISKEVNKQKRWYLLRHKLSRDYYKPDGLHFYSRGTAKYAHEIRHIVRNVRSR